MTLKVFAQRLLDHSAVMSAGIHRRLETGADRFARISNAGSIRRADFAQRVTCSLFDLAGSLRNV